MSDLVVKEIYDIYETKNLTKNQIRKYKMTEREAFKKFSDLSEDKLNRNIIKMFTSLFVYVDCLLLKNIEVKKKSPKKKKKKKEKKCIQQKKKKKKKKKKDAFNR